MRDPLRYSSPFDFLLEDVHSAWRRRRLNPTADFAEVIETAIRGLARALPAFHGDIALELLDQIGTLVDRIHESRRPLTRRNATGVVCRVLLERAVYRAIEVLAASQKDRHMRQFVRDLHGGEAWEIADRLQCEYRPIRTRLACVRRAVKNAFLDKKRAKDRRGEVLLAALHDESEGAIGGFELADGRESMYPTQAAEVQARREKDVRAELAELDRERATLIALVRSTTKKAGLRKLLSRLRAIEERRLLCLQYLREYADAAVA